MPVYVDNARIPYGRMLMCHMIADTPEELHAMADQIGVSRRWVQHPGTPLEHYDICASKREKAIQAGAIAISWREYSRMVRGRSAA